MANIAGLRDKYSKIEGERFFHEIWEGKEYEKALSVKADVVIDIGALAGEFSSYIYDKAKVIYALEPCSEHYAELIDNIDEFGLDKIKPFWLALGDENGEGILTITGRGGHFLIKPDDNAVKINKVPVKTLATFMKDNKIKHVDVLKIDCEGGELAIFTSRDFPEVASKIDYIIGEHLAEVSDHLVSLGFTKTEERPNTVFQRI